MLIIIFLLVPSNRLGERAISSCKSGVSMIFIGKILRKQKNSEIIVHGFVRNIFLIINRPGVAGDVLQKPLSLIH